MNDIFEQATRRGLRFDSSKGVLTVEDLWNLPLTSETKTNLDEIAINLNNKLKGSSVSFVSQAQKVSDDDVLRFELVKHIIEVRVAERDAAQLAEARRQQRAALQELISRKEAEALGEKSLDELRELLSQLK